MEPVNAGSGDDAGGFLDGIERSHGELAKFFSSRTAGLVVDAILVEVGDVVADESPQMLVIQWYHVIQ